MVEVQWSTIEMTEAQKQVVRSVMKKRQVKLMKRYGEISHRNVKLLVACSAIQSHVKHKLEGRIPSDVAWSWVAEEQAEGRLTQLTRMMTGPIREEQIGWQRTAMMMSGWMRDTQGLMSELVFRLHNVAERVLRVLRRKAAGKATTTTFMGGSDKPEPLYLTAKVVAMAWQAVKSGMKGPGGKKIFWGAIGLLMMQGKVEGHVGKSPLEGSWTALASSVMGKMPAIKSLKERGHRAQKGGSEAELEVYMDLGAASQASRQEAEAAGMYYLGMDTRQWVFNATRQEWMENIVVDYTQESPERMWRIAKREIAKETGWKGRIRLAFVWASPPCHTFSVAQVINAWRMCNYRDHRKPGKPPVAGNTKYSKEARRSDKLVQHLLTIFAWAESQKVAWAMENPLGFLACRPYMKRMKVKHVRHLVNYCAFGGWYKKPTHIWTNIRWQPRGVTGSGRCDNKCPSGDMGVHGRWKHRYAIAQQSWRAVSGQGRVSMKSEVPAMIHKEMIAVRASLL